MLWKASRPPKDTNLGAPKPNKLRPGSKFNAPGAQNLDFGPSAFQEEVCGLQRSPKIGQVGPAGGLHGGHRCFLDRRFHRMQILSAVPRDLRRRVREMAQSVVNWSKVEGSCHTDSLWRYESDLLMQARAAKPLASSPASSSQSLSWARWKARIGYRHSRASSAAAHQNLRAAAESRRRKAHRPRTARQEARIGGFQA